VRVAARQILVAASALLVEQGAHGQEPTVLEVEIVEYRTKVVPISVACPDGRQVDAGRQRLTFYNAAVTGVISGEFDGATVAFASGSALNFQCVELSPLLSGRYESTGQRVRDLGAEFMASAYSCGDFRPRCVTEPGSSSRSCYWDDWLLDVEDTAAAAAAPEAPQPDFGLIDRFLSVRDFELVESLAALPSDVQDLLPRWSDGSFSIAEKGEDWNKTDVVNSCNPRKSSGHWMSGVADDMAVIFFERGGIAVFSNVHIIDRRTGAGVICYLAAGTMYEWKGTNHTDAMFLPRPGDEGSVPWCRVPAADTGILAP
jgi:hypothetical protein